MDYIDKSFRGQGDIAKLMQPGRERTQDLRGFDEDYTDIVDYIVRCTHKIWEEGGMGRLYTHYAHNVAVHTAYGLSYGREEMLASSISALSAFPDRKAYADDVIWAGNDEDGFHTSHRIISVARNTGYSKYGPPTGRRVCYRTIANCYVKENRILEEWLVRDESAVVRQLGLDPQEVARRLVEEDVVGRQDSAFPGGEIRRIKGQTTPEALPPRETGAFDVEDFVRRCTHEIWNWRLFNRIHERFAPNYLCYTAGNRTIYGLGDYQAYVMALITMFPDAFLQIDHLYWLGNDEDGYRVASRWTLLGTHDGPGIYGSPTGKRVGIMGISHFWVQGGKFVREWTVFDEVAVLRQLLSSW
jgi:predicted ester cyclase